MLGASLLVSACSQYPPPAEQDVSDADSSQVASEGSNEDADQPVGDVEGADAIWRVPEGVELDSSARSFPVDVYRVSCNSGVTGEVLAPTVEEVGQRVVVTFTVVPATGGVTCRANVGVSSTVRLSRPLGGRSLYDGECLPASTAAAPGLCRLGGLRYPLARPR
jgi:hypothetical protein